MFRQRAPSSELRLYHNSAHPHITATAIETILNLKSVVQPHAPQSRDFAACDFHAFGSLKETSRYHPFLVTKKWKKRCLTLRRLMSYIYIYIYIYIWSTHSWCFSITHNDAPQSVGLLWTSDQLVAETSTWQHTTLTTDKYSCPRWDSNPRSWQASGRSEGNF